GAGAVARGRRHLGQPRLLPHRAGRGVCRSSSGPALTVATGEPGLAAGHGLPVSRSVLRLVEARARRQGRRLGHPVARPREGVRPQRRREERALPAGRNLQRARPRRRRRGALRSAVDVLSELPGAEELSPPDQPDGDDQPEGMMKRGGLVRFLVLAAAFAALPALALALEEQSLLTPDGTLYVVRSGRAVDLAVEGVNPDSFLLECTTLTQA